jgi:cell division protein FtsN
VAARRNRRRSAGVATPRRRRGTPAWLLVAAGLAIGALGVGAWSFIKTKLVDAPAAPAAKASPPRPRPAARANPKPPEKRFAFYDMLPNFEVVIPEEDREVRPDKTPAPIDAPGVYVLQAGSYGSFAEADQVKARLALLGVGSQIQRITVDDREYHRVRVGPIEELTELNRVRAKLRAAKIDALVIRVGE